MPGHDRPIRKSGWSVIKAIIEQKLYNDISPVDCKVNVWTMVDDRVITCHINTQRPRWGASGTSMYVASSAFRRTNHPQRFNGAFFMDGTINGYRFRSKKLPVPPKFITKDPHLGKTFGRLFVESFLGMTGDGYRWYGCACVCGVKCAVRSRELIRGHTKSCGCLQLETVRESAGKNKKPFGHASRNELLSSYIKSARDRSIEWAIEPEQFFSIVSSDCAYCGIRPDSYRKPNTQVNGGFWYSGIDRIDNSRGYVQGNIIACCWTCNRAKATMTLNEFASWMKRLVKNFDRSRFEFGETPKC